MQDVLEAKFLKRRKCFGGIPQEELNCIKEGLKAHPEEDWHMLDSR